MNCSSFRKCNVTYMRLLYWVYIKNKSWELPRAVNSRDLQEPDPPAPLTFFQAVYDAHILSFPETKEDVMSLYAELTSLMEDL